MVYTLAGTYYLLLVDIGISVLLCMIGPLSCLYQTLIKRTARYQH